MDWDYTFPALILKHTGNNSKQIISNDTLCQLILPTSHWEQENIEKVQSD